MSEQADKLNETLRSRGILPPEEPPRDGAEDDGDGGRPKLPTIELPRDGRGLDDFAREAGMVTRLNGVFVRESVPVTISKLGSIEEMAADRFRTYLAKEAFVFKWKSPGKDQPPDKVKMTMTKDCASGVLHSDQFVDQQRPLARVNSVRQPAIRRDGSLALLPIGYDAESGIFTQQNEVVIDDHMTVEEGRAMLTDLLREFKFPDWVDQPINERSQSLFLARQVALMTSFFGASLIPPLAKRQGGFMNANREGSGKGLLVSLVIMPVMGFSAFGEKPETQEDMKKMLDAVTVSALPYVVIDDISPGNLKSQALNSFMTSTHRQVKLMYTQRQVFMPVTASVYMTGHGVTLTGDLVRRCLEVKLQMEEANVAEHKVTREITESWLASPAARGQICSALWALIRHWDKMGRPKGPTIKGGWLEWCETFGGIVHAAGFGDPCAQLAAEDSPDPEYADMHALVAHFFPEGDDAQPVVEVTFDQMVEASIHLNAFAWLIDGRWRGGGKDADGQDLARWYETNAKSNSRLGTLWSLKYGGAIFRLSGGRVVQFGHRGKNRHKKYTLALKT